MNLDLLIECEDGEGYTRAVSLNVTYTPGRPAPRCSDPDAAAFSDPGEAPEIRIHSAAFVGELLTPSPAYLADDYFQDLLHLKAREAYEAL